MERSRWLLLDLLTIFKCLNYFCLITYFILCCPQSSLLNERLQPTSDLREVANKFLAVVGGFTFPE